MRTIACSLFSFLLLVGSLLPGQLYKEDFSKDPANWRTENTAYQQWRTMHLKPHSEGVAMAWQKTTYNGVFLQVRTEFVGGAKTGFYGIMFGFKSAREYLALLINGNGDYVVLDKREPGVKILKIDAKNKHLAGQAVNHLGVETGATMKFYLNGHEVFSAKPRPDTGGYIGFLAEDAHVHFDDLAVHSTRPVKPLFHSTPEADLKGNLRSELGGFRQYFEPGQFPAAWSSIKEPGYFAFSESAGILSSRDRIPDITAYNIEVEIEFITGEHVDLGAHQYAGILFDDPEKENEGCKFKVFSSKEFSIECVQFNVKLKDQEIRKQAHEAVTETVNTLRIERRGEHSRFYVNGEQVAAGKIGAYGLLYGFEADVADAVLLRRYDVEGVTLGTFDSLQTFYDRTCSWIEDLLEFKGNTEIYIIAIGSILLLSGIALFIYFKQRKRLNL